MSFDIFFHTCNLGTSKKRVTNPFTRRHMMVFDDPGLTCDERAAVRKLLRNLGAEGPSEFGTYSLSFGDGGEADLSMDGLDGNDKVTGCSVQTRGLSPDVVEFLFRLSRSGNMVMTPAAEGVGDLVTSAEQQQRIASRFPDVTVVSSTAALAKALERGFEAWRQYRDQIVRDDG
jgi:hypothetical protein